MKKPLNAPHSKLKMYIALNWSDASRMQDVSINSVKPLSKCCNWNDLKFLFCLMFYEIQRKMHALFGFKMKSFSLN